MADENPDPLVKQSHLLATAVIDSIVTHMLAAAKKAGGTLGTAEILKLTEEWKGKTADLEAVFRDSFDRVVRIKQTSNWARMRQNPFVRHVVKTFSHLLPDAATGQLEPGHLSRRMLPGFFHALDMMLGEDLHDELLARAETVLDRIEDRFGDKFSWDAYYADRDAKAVMTDAMMAVLPHFTNSRKRGAWFVNVVNGNLANSETAVKREGPLAADWELSEALFFDLADALFFDVRTALAAPTAAEVMNERYGAAACRDARAVLDALDQARPRPSDGPGP